MSYKIDRCCLRFRSRLFSSASRFLPYSRPFLSSTAFLRGQRLPQALLQGMIHFQAFGCSERFPLESLQFVPPRQEFALYVDRGEAFQVRQSLIIAFRIRGLDSADAFIASGLP